MANSWTPGPWVQVAKGVPIVVTGKGGETLIASTACKGMLGTIQDANARLIAHAPEMAEALEQIIRVADAYRDANPMSMQADCVVKARSLLSRIRGETEGQ